MAIVRNTAFAGSSIYQVDPGAQTLPPVLKNAQADVAGVVAHLTDDTIPTHIDHSGNGRGCLLGVPQVNQQMGVSLILDAAGKTNGGAVSGADIQFPFFVLVAPGETSVTVEITTEDVDFIVGVGDIVPRFHLCALGNWATAAGSVVEQSMVAAILDDGIRPLTRWAVTIGGIAAPGMFLGVVLIPARFRSDGTKFPVLRDVSIRPTRGAGAAFVATGGDSSNPTGVVAPSSTQSLFHQPMDAALFDGTVYPDGITGWHVSRIDRNINGALEYVTGAPAPGNGTYTHTESALRGPSRDRFSSATRKTAPDEPVPKTPVMSVCFGGIKTGGGYLVDPAVPAEVAAREAFAPYPPSATLIDLGVQAMEMSDAPSGVLRVAVLLGQNGGVGWTNVRTQPQIEALAAPTAIAPTQVTGATHLAAALFAAVPFTRDSVSNRLRIAASQVAGGWAATNYCLLAAAAWIEE